MRGAIISPILLTSFCKSSHLLRSLRGPNPVMRAEKLGRFPQHGVCDLVFGEFFL